MSEGQTDEVAWMVAESVIADASNYPMSVVPHVVSRDMSKLIGAVADAFMTAGYRKVEG